MTNREIDAGEVVLASTAAALLPLSGERGCCDFCVIGTGVAQCSACKFARYCDKAHAMGSWKAEHRFECKKITALQRAHPAAASDIVLLSRLWRATRAVSEEDEATTRAVYRHTFADVLRLHRTADETRIAGCRMAAAAAAAGGWLEGGAALSQAALFSSKGPEFASGGSERLPESVATAILSAFECNNFLVVDDLFHGRAAGVFPAGALLNHSCAPNATLTYMSETQYCASIAATGVHGSALPAGASPAAAGAGAGAGSPGSSAGSSSLSSDGRLVQVVRALRRISAGEEVCHSFVEIAMPRDRRREQLRATYGFDCTCELCDAENVDSIDASSKLGSGSGSAAAAGGEGSTVASERVAAAAAARRAFEAGADGSHLPSPTLSLPGQPRGGIGPLKAVAADAADDAPAEEQQLRAWLQLGRGLLLETSHALAIAGEHASSEPHAPAQVRALLSLLQERWAVIEAAAATAKAAISREDSSGSGSSAAPPPSVASVLALLPALDAHALRPSEPLSRRVACVLRLSEAATVAQLRGRLDVAKLPAPPAAAASAAGLGSSGGLDLDEAARRKLQYGSYYASPIFLRGAAVPLPEQRAAATEVEYIETALAVMRSRSPAGPGAAPFHLTVQAAVNALLARYLLLHDVPAAAAACEYICAFYAAAFAACGAHPLWGLQLYTLADLLAELHDTAHSVATAALRSRLTATEPAAGPAGFSARSKPLDAAAAAPQAKVPLGRNALVTAERWQRLRYLLQPTTAGSGSTDDARLLDLPLDAVDLGDASEATRMLKSLRSLAATAYSSSGRMLSATHGPSHEMAASARARAEEMCK